MKTYLKILPLAIALTACGGGSSSPDPVETPVTTTPSYPASGTILSESCDGYTLIEEIADGNGGSTQQKTLNSPQCGYETPVTTTPSYPALGTTDGTGYCEGYALLQNYHDGNGGTYTETVEDPSEQCGYIPPEEAGTVLDEYCEDPYTKVIVTADGGGGELIDRTENSEECGYVPPPEVGTLLGDSYCAGTLTPEEYDPHFENINHLLPEDRLQDYADGEGGSYTERTVHLDQTCFTQMTIPQDCPTARTDTGDPRYEYLTCDGIKQKTGVSFPYQPKSEHAGRAIIDMLFVVDTALTEEDRDGMTVEEFVDKQIYESNHMYMVSGTYTLIRRAGIIMVDVAPGDLYRQYSAFFNERYEFQGLSDWQREAEADLAFLFKKRPEEPIACGVANLDATRGIDKTRGITQCFHNSTFQEYETTRYYQRAHETFAHEIGHLLGAQHHYDDVKSDWGLFEYSYGHHLEGYNPQVDNPDYEGIYGGFGTIMTYADLPTGRFSDYNVRCTFGEGTGEYEGQSVPLGTTGGCFCLEPIENQPPPTNNAETILRTRWVMSQLHEMEHGVQFSPITNMEMDGLSVEEDPEICLF